MKEISVLFYINEKNTHLAISDNNEIKVIDMSLGYGNAYMTSTVLYSIAEYKYVFFDNVNDYDIDDDVILYDSILNLFQKSDIDTILVSFCEQMLNFVNDFDSDATIKVIRVCYENNASFKNQLFITAFDTLGYKKDKIKFISQRDALYNCVNNDDEVNILFLDYSKITLKKLVKNIDDSYKEEIQNFDCSLKELEEVFINKFLEYVDMDDIENVINIKKVINENFNLIVDKYMKNEDFTTYLNFCFPPVSVNLTVSEMETIFDAVLSKINLETTNVYVYSEFNLLSILKRKYLKDCELIKIDILEGINSSIKIKIDNAQSKKCDIGFFINNNSASEFIPIITTEDTLNTRFKEQYFYYLKKYGDELTLYKKIDENAFDEIQSISLEKLNIQNDISMLKSKVTAEKDKFMIELSNHGFLNKNMMLGKILVSIEEV